MYDGWFVVFLQFTQAKLGGREVCKVPLDFKFLQELQEVKRQGILAGTHTNESLIQHVDVVLP